MIHAFCAPRKQLQETSCFSNQASPGLLMTMISEAVHCRGPEACWRPGGKGAGQLHLPVSGEGPRPTATGVSPPNARLEHLIVPQLPSVPPAPRSGSPCTAFCPFAPALFCHPAGWVFWGGRILMDTSHPKLSESLHRWRGCSGLWRGGGGVCAP